MDQRDVHDLLRDLASDDPNVVEEAGFALRGRLDGVTPLLNAVPALDPFGKLTAIEVIESWPLDVARGAVDPTVGEVIVPLLRHEVDTVRDWSARVLGWIGDREAVPEIEAALRRSREAGIPPDWTEPVSFRQALSDLGAREPVVPARAKALMRNEPELGPSWAAHDLMAVVDSLADASQLVLYIQAWRREQETFHWVSAPDIDVDVAGDWGEVVSRGRARVARALAEWSPVDGTVATLEWIAEADR